MKELIEIQSELKVPKDNYNSFGKYKYRSAEDILESVKPLCKKHNCLLTLNDDLEMYGDRFYVKATAKLTNGAETVSVTAFAREEETKKGMDGSQITGTASSYARKYALNGMFCIDDTKDADTDEFIKTAKASESTKKTKSDLITDGGVDYLTNLCIEVNSDPVAVCKYFGVRSFAEMDTNEFNKATKMLESKLKKGE